MDFSYNISDYRRQATNTLSVIAHPGRVLVWLATVLRVAAVNFINNNDLLWASALTYTVTLSIVPILALAFSVLKGLGGTERLQPFIQHYIALGSSETTDQLMGLVGNVNAATLGSVGGAALLLTVISTLGTIENAFNTIWQVPAGRSYLRKFTDYLSVVFTIPLVLVAAVTLTASFSTRLHNWHMLSLVLPSLILWVGFFFLFVFFPYTRVRWRAAALGSFFTAVLFQLAQWAYIHFWVGMSSYKAIYGALAIIPVLLLWIYLGWIIVLFGVEICFAAQRGTTRYESLPRSLNFTRYAVLLTLLRLAERFSDRRQTVTVESLAGELRVPASELAATVERLKESGLVIESSGNHATRTGLFLSIDPAAIKLGEAFRDLEIGGWGEPRVADLLGRLQELETRRLDEITLRDLQQGGATLAARIASSPSGRHEVS